MSTERPRILFLCSRVPQNEFSGFNVEVLNTLRILNRRYQVDLVCLSRGSTPDISLAELQKVVNSVTVFKISLGSIAKGIFKAVLAGRPVQVGFYDSKALADWIGERASSYQLLICHLLRTAEYGNNFSGAKVVELSDSIGRHYSTGGGVGSIKWRFIRRLEAKRIIRYEGELLRKFDLAFMHTEVDRRYTIEAHPHGKDVLKIFSFGIPEEFELDPPIKPQRQTGDRFVIQFVGKMDYEPNVDAVIFFANQVFPLVRQTIPNTQFHIVGDRPSDSVKKLAENPDVVVTGRVDNLLESVRSADVSVVPTRIGGGIQTKALQAMSQRIPVVISSLAAGGIDGTDGVHFLVADNPAKIAEAVERIHADRNLAENLGRTARELILQKYLWSAVESQYVADIEQLVTSSKQ